MRTVRYTAVSTVDVHRLISCGKIIKAPVCQSFFCEGSLDARSVDRSPVAFPSVGRLIGQPFRHFEPTQSSKSCLGQFPLFPNTHTYATVQPSIDVFDVRFHARDTVVSKPTSHIDSDSLQGVNYATAVTPGSESSQFILDFLPWFGVYTDVNAFTILPEAEAKVFKI